MHSASLEIVTRLIREYKRVLRIGFFSNLILVLNMKIQQCYSLLLVSFPWLIQGKIDERNFIEWKATRWMESSHNASGIEWWKVGTMNPRWYSWQPNHGDLGKLYTKKPHRPVKFGSAESRSPGLTRALALQHQKALRIIAAANNSKATNSTHSIDNPFPPIIPHRIPKPFYPSQDTGPPIPAEVNITDLACESTRRFAELRALRKRRQATPDAITELGLSEQQHRDLKAHVNRRFLVGYDCSKPMDVKPISSFIHDPCEPAEANNKETYDIQPLTQFQIVQYKTRREFLGTRCERYISQFTHYCGNADHASPLPQEIFFRRP